MRRNILTVLVLVLLPMFAGCGEDKHESPEATITALRTYVEQGRADKITKLVYADSKNMRRLLDRFGVFLAHLQTLAVVVQEKFPKEIEAMRAKAEAAAKAGKATSLLSQMTSQMRKGGKKGVQIEIGTGPGGNDTRDLFNDTMRQVFADPYAWIRESERRMTTEFLTDDSVAILWDNEAVLPPIGMIMKQAKEDGQWYFVLPTNLPGLSKVFPKTDRQFEIWGGMITVFDKMVVDLTKEVKAGRVKTLDDLSRRAGEMAFMPAMFTVFAYSQLEETKKKPTPPPPKPPAETKPEGK